VVHATRSDQLTLLRKFLLVRVRPGDRPRKCPQGRTGAQVGLRGDCSAPRGVGERAGATGHGVSTRGSDQTLIFRGLKPPTGGKEYSVLLVGPDEDKGGVKVPLMILDARHRPRDVAQMRRLALSSAVQLEQPARQLRHGRDYCGTFDGERHLIGGGGYSVSCRVYYKNAGSEDNEKQRERYYANRFGKNQLDNL